MARYMAVSSTKSLTLDLACSGRSPASKRYRTHMGHKWVFMWVLYGQPIRDSWGICNMVSCWTHMGKAIWELYGSSKGKSTHIYLPGKNNNKLLDIFTQMIVSPQSQPIWWTGKVPTDRDLRTCAIYCTCVESRGLKDICVLFNSWTWCPHAYLYIPQF